MAVRRIVANIDTPDPASVAAFYREVFGLETVMDLGWIQTMASADANPAPQISLASEGGSGTSVPALSVEVDDLDDVLARARGQGHAIEYGPVLEPWGVTRFYLRDPAGTLLNVLSHPAEQGN